MQSKTITTAAAAATTKKKAKKTIPITESKKLENKNTQTKNTHNSPRSHANSLLYHIN